MPTACQSQPPLSRHVMVAACGYAESVVQPKSRWANNRPSPAHATNPIASQNLGTGVAHQRRTLRLCFWLGSCLGEAAYWPSRPRTTAWRAARRASTGTAIRGRPRRNHVAVAAMVACCCAQIGQTLTWRSTTARCSASSSSTQVKAPGVRQPRSSSRRKVRFPRRRDDEREPAPWFGVSTVPHLLSADRSQPGSAPRPLALAPAPPRTR